MLNKFKIILGTAKIGSYMLLIAWLLFMAILTYFFSNWLSNSVNPNSNARVVTSTSGEQIITLKVNRYNHYMVPGGVNGFNVNFLVDTGATRVSVPGHIAKTIGLKPDKEIRVLTASGETNAYTTIIDSLVIAGIEFVNVKATITPSDNSDNVLLGMSILKKFSFVQEKGVLILKLNQY